MEKLFPQFVITDINIESIIRQYAEIDAYSQGTLTGKPLGISARNMGKNDLWIAATASALDLTLLTTDKDFEHLNGVFLDLVRM
jgi:tRNA(fMet)-specific endonuclease VapC